MKAMVSGAQTPLMTLIMISSSFLMTLMLVIILPLLLNHKHLLHDGGGGPLVEKTSFDYNNTDNTIVPDPVRDPKDEIFEPPELPERTLSPVEPRDSSPAPAEKVPILVKVPIPSLTLSGLHDLSMKSEPALFSFPAASGEKFNLDEVDRKPEGISTIQPMYPYRARRLALEGYVAVRFLVDRNGSVSDLTILKAEPKGVFERTVGRTLPKWRFRPGRKDGKPVDTWVKKTIEFRLTEDG